MFPSIIDVFDIIVEDGATSEQKGEAEHLLDFMQTNYHKHYKEKIKIL